MEPSNKFPSFLGILQRAKGVSVEYISILFDLLLQWVGPVTDAEQVTAILQNYSVYSSINFRFFFRTSFISIY